jgi:hypothetical protein
MNQRTFPDLSEVKTSTVPTDQAAVYLGRKPATLRLYGRSAEAPIKPIRFGGRYLWRTADIKAIVGVAE